MSCGLKNACSTDRAPGASRKIAASAPTTIRVLTVETTVPPRPLPSSREPRPLRANEPGGCQPPPTETPGGPPATGPPATGPAPASPLPGSPDGGGWCSSIWGGGSLLRSGLDGREGEVDLQVFLLELLQGAVALELCDRLI